MALDYSCLHVYDLKEPQNTEITIREVRKPLKINQNCSLKLKSDSFGQVQSTNVEGTEIGRNDRIYFNLILTACHSALYLPTM
jgi:hypothetical protein